MSIYKEKQMIFYFLVGGLITLLGVVFYLFPPKKINPYYGYRTKRSMRNQQTWDAANKYSTVLMILAGILTLISGAIAVLLGASVLIPHIMIFVFLGLLLVLTERYLKEQFGE